MVGTGSAVSPFNFGLSAQGYRQDRSDDHATLDGLKRSRLSLSLVYRPCPLWSFIARSASGRVTQTIRPVSQATGVSAVPHT